MTQLLPAPGIIIAAFFDPASTSPLVFTSKTDSRILQGKVTAVGSNVITPMGNEIILSDYCSVGDLICFLSYQGDYDNLTIDGQKYYVVKAEDVRAVIK